MTLGFKQYFPWHTEKNPAPTNFREKIIERLHENQPNPIVWTPKIHTMRADPTNRWKAGRKIEMVYRGAGYKIIDHFNKGIPELGVCTGVQEVRISWTYKNKYIETPLPTITMVADARHLPERKPMSFDFYPKVFIDYEELDNEEIQNLAHNDGFNSVEDFFRWFNKDWSGKIIHWSNFRY